MCTSEVDIVLYTIYFSIRLISLVITSSETWWDLPSDQMVGGNCALYNIVLLVHHKNSMLSNKMGKIALILYLDLLKLLYCATSV